MQGIFEDFPSGRVVQWNANVEHQLSANLAANVGYVGSQGTYLQNGKSLNVPRPAAGAIQPRRPYPQYANVSMFCACFPSSPVHSAINAVRRFFTVDGASPCRSQRLSTVSISTV